MFLKSSFPSSSYRTTIGAWFGFPLTVGHVLREMSRYVCYAIFEGAEFTDKVKYVFPKGVFTETRRAGNNHCNWSEETRKRDRDIKSSSRKGVVSTGCTLC